MRLFTYFTADYIKYAKAMMSSINLPIEIICPVEMFHEFPDSALLDIEPYLNNAKNKFTKPLYFIYLYRLLQLNNEHAVFLDCDLLFEMGTEWLFENLPKDVPAFFTKDDGKIHTSLISKPPNTLKHILNKLNIDEVVDGFDGEFIRNNLNEEYYILNNNIEYVAFEDYVKRDYSECVVHLYNSGRTLVQNGILNYKLLPKIYTKSLNYLKN